VLDEEDCMLTPQVFLSGTTSLCCVAIFEPWPAAGSAHHAENVPE